MKTLQAYVAPASGKNPAPLNITRKDFNLSGARCWVLNNFLSRIECEYYIDAAEKLGYESIETEYPKDYRDCVRVGSYSVSLAFCLLPSFRLCTTQYALFKMSPVARSTTLAEQLWGRLVPTLHQKDIQGIRPYGYGNEGLWTPLGINDCFRFSKYFVGGHFNRHLDGAFVPSEDLRSIYTLMVYLNDDFDGGVTQFFDEQDQLVVEFKPQRGTAIIFNHDVKHSGAAISSGHKYIFRTDIMFHRIAIDPNYDAQAVFSDPGYLESDRLFSKSYKLQKAGHATESTQAFLAAMAIAAQRPSISPTSSPEEDVAAPADNASPLNDTLPVFDRVPIHVWLKIFQQLSVCDILNFGSVSKHAHLMMTDPSVWRDQYFARWSPNVENLQALFLEHQKVMSNFRSDNEVNAPSSSGAVANSSNLSQQFTATMRDWYSIYRSRALSAKDFQIVVVDIGGIHTKFFGFGLHCLDTTGQPIANRYRRKHIELRVLWSRLKNQIKPVLPPVPNSDPPLNIENPQRSTWGKIRSIYARDAEHIHALVRKGRCIMFAGDAEIEDTDGPATWRRLYEPYYHSRAFSTSGIETIIKWIYTNMFDREISCQQHPLLFSVPSWMDSDQQIEVHNYLFTTMQVPYLAMIDASVLALQSHGFMTGILVSVGGQFTYVAAIVEGAVLDAPVKKFEVISDQSDDISSMPSATELDEYTVLDRYFSTISPDPSVNPVDLVSLINQRLQLAAVPEDTKVALKKHIIVSGGHAYAVAPILRSRLGPGEYKVYGPNNSGSGQFDVVRGAENLLTMPQTKESIRALFTSIDEYAASAESFPNPPSRPTPAFYVSSPSQT